MHDFVFYKNTDLQKIGIRNKIKQLQTIGPSLQVDGKAWDKEAVEKNDDLGC